MPKTSLAQPKDGFEQVLINAKKTSNQLKNELKLFFILHEGLLDIKTYFTHNNALAEF